MEEFTISPVVIATTSTYDSNWVSGRYVKFMQLNPTKMVKVQSLFYHKKTYSYVPLVFNLFHSWPLHLPQFKTLMQLPAQYDFIVHQINLIYLQKVSWAPKFNWFLWLRLGGGKLWILLVLLVSAFDYHQVYYRYSIKIRRQQTVIFSTCKAEYIPLAIARVKRF